MESKMKSIVRSLAVLAIVAGMSSSAFAQETNNDIIRPITKSGSAAFLFSMNGLGTFGIGTVSLAPGLGGAGFGMKYFIADDFALRVLLGFGSNSVGDDSTGTNSMFGIGIGGEYHFRPLYSTSPYVGAQLGFQSNSETSKSGFGKSVHSTTAIGFAALAGFDWFFTRGIAVGAEYSLGIVTRSGETENTPTTGSATTTEDTDSSTIGFNTAGSGNVHVAVYF
jgi:opacity protein-like surface antigen